MTGTGRGYLNIRTKPGAEHHRLALAHMEYTWQEFTGDAPFQYIFLDAFYDDFYAEEKRTGIITLIFSILSVFIASLGLFGMTLYNTQKRTREIGIRKVMGATETNIIGWWPGESCSHWSCRSSLPGRLPGT